MIQKTDSNFINDFLSLFYQRIVLEDYEEDEEIEKLSLHVMEKHLKLKQSLSAEQNHLLDDFQRFLEGYYAMTQEAYFQIGFQYGAALSGEFEEKNSLSCEEMKKLAMILDRLVMENRD